MLPEVIEKKLAQVKARSQTAARVFALLMIGNIPVERRKRWIADALQMSDVEVHQALNILSKMGVIGGDAPDPLTKSN